MIRYKIYTLLLVYATIQLTIAEDSSNLPENKIYDGSSPLDGGASQKTISADKKSDHDLTAAAAGYGNARYLSAPSSFRENPRNCYECNREPWIPIVGRSLHFPTSASHSLQEIGHHSAKPYFKEKLHLNKHYADHHRPPLDAYGAPQGTYTYPRDGEVVDFMLPPPFHSDHHQSDNNGVYELPPSTYGPPKQIYGPPVAQYGPPKPVYGPPKPVHGPPPYTHSNTQNIFDLNPPPPQHIANPPSVSYGVASTDISPPPSVNYRPPAPSFSPLPTYEGPPTIPTRYGSPGIHLNNYNQFPRRNIPTTHLRPVSQEFQPPLPGPGVRNLPLENNPPPHVSSDSYGKPLGPANLPLSDVHFPAVAPSDSYGAPVTGDHQRYVEPVTLGSGDSEEFGRDIGYFETQQNEELRNSLYGKGLTDVQVVPSVRVADYTASIEHPINLIQSPILDLNVQHQDGHQEVSSSQEKANAFDESIQESYYGKDSAENIYDARQNSIKMSENPIIVEDTYTSASNINSTYSTRDNSTAIKRHNDKFTSTEAFGSSSVERAKDTDLTTNLIQKLILEHNFIQDPHTQIVGIKKGTIDPKKLTTKLEVVQSVDGSSSWTSMHAPSKTSVDTWTTHINDSASLSKSSKKLQIIVPYSRAPLNSLDWAQTSQKVPALYNRSYTTLTPVFVPPPMSTESSNLWTKFLEDIGSVESHRGQAQGFARESATEVYNIKDFLVKQQGKYDPYSLQKNIDDWTHQSYANRLNYGNKLPTTKLAHVKNIPREYLTTSSSNDSPVSSELKGDFRGELNYASSSENRNLISKEIVDNLILPEDSTTQIFRAQSASETSTVPSIKYVVKQPSWQKDKVVLSNSTHEKVYVVTPQSYTHVIASTPATAFSMAPRIQNGKVNNVATITKISVRVEAPSEERDGKKLGPVKVVYSEWPHLINNLATTTTTQRPTSRHPLFGLMDLSAYTAPPNATVETIGGHSRVTSVVTTPFTKLTSTTAMPSTETNETVKVSPSAA